MERTELGKLVSDLVRIPSVSSDSKGTREIACFVRDWLQARGVEARITEFVENYPVVIAEAGKGDRTVLLNGHMDVVSGQDSAKWTGGDPFSGAMRDGKVYGRGAADMKGGLAVMMANVVELASVANCKLVFTAVSDEETGGFKCAKHLAETQHPDLVLIPEPTNTNYIGLGEKGVFRIRLVATGRTAHSSTPEKKDNAILTLHREIDALSRIEKSRFETSQEIGDVLRSSRRLFGGKMDRISFCPTMESSGTEENVQPDRAEATIDLRIPPGTTFGEALGLVRNIEKTASILIKRNGTAPEPLYDPLVRSKGASAEIIVTRSEEPNYTSPSNEYAVAFKKAADKYVENAQYVFFAAATDGKYFRSMKVPTIVCGPGRLKDIHTYDEHIGLAELETSHRVYTEFLSGLA